MGSFLGNIGGGQIILIPLMIVFIIAYRRWQSRQVLWDFKSVLFDVLGVPCTLITLFTSLVLLFDQMSPAGTGSVGTWFVIYALMTLGIVPLILLFIYYLAGRFVGRMMQLWRLRKLGRNLGRQADTA